VSSAPAVLELVELDVRYGGVPAVRDLSLEVRAGEIVGLIGPNGAGKSTTLHAIMGATSIHAGDVRFHGRSLRGASPEVIARAGIALVPEGRRIYADLSVDENLRLGLAGRRSREGAEEDLQAVRDLFPVVDEFRSRRAGVLSGGQQQQLAIARGLAARPEVLLLDEPSLGLAPTIVKAFYELVRSLHHEMGLTVLVVEQNAGVALQSTKRTYVLEVGRVTMEGPSEELRKDERIRKSYLG